MKNKISITIIFVILTFLTVLVGNKTFLGASYNVKNSEGDKIKIPVPLLSYYVDTNTETIFSTFRSSESIRNSLNKYLDGLEACYDESYFYDYELDITIFKYYVEDDSPFNKIYLDYQLGNYCKDEYVLDDNWISEFQSKAKVSETKLETCISDKCSEKDVDLKNVNGLLNYVATYTRTKSKNNLDINSEYVTKIYYTMGKNSYVMYMFKYKDYLGVKVMDQDERQKNAIYELNDEINNLLKNIYEN